MVDYKHYPVEKKPTKLTNAGVNFLITVFFFIGLTLGAVIGSQGMRWQIDHDIDGIMSAVTDTYTGYQADADPEARAHASKASRNLVRRVAP